MKRVLTDLSQSAVLNEVLTPLKRNHAPSFQSPCLTMLGIQPQCYQNIYKQSENDGFFPMAQADKGHLHPQQEESTTYKAFYPFKTQDSFGYTNIASYHRNSFAENLIEANESKYREAGLESILAPRNNYLENDFFGCLDNPNQNQRQVCGFPEQNNGDYMTDQDLATPFESNCQQSYESQLQDFNSNSVQTGFLPPDQVNYEENNENMSDESTNLKIVLKKKNKKYQLLKTKTRASSRSHTIQKKNKVVKNLKAGKKVLKTLTKANLPINKLSIPDKKKKTLLKLSSNTVKNRALPALEKVTKSTESTKSSISSSSSSTTAIPQQTPVTYKIGPLSLPDRLQKVMKYIQKKQTKSQMKKYCYKCRKQVAEKRLRIKGRFVTKSQAFEILGISSIELRNNEIIQKLLENHANSGLYNSQQPMIQLNSLVESENGQKSIKIRNFQALIDDNYNHNSNTNATFPKFLTKGTSFTSTECTVDNTTSDQPDSPKFEEELLRHLQLNLRISTTKDGKSSTNNHVAKVLIQHYTANRLNELATGMGEEVDENLKMRLNNLRLEGYVQPLFKVEKYYDAKNI